MGFQSSRLVACVVALFAGSSIVACQGNVGGGTGLSIPQAPGYGQPAGPGGGAQSQSRERVLDGAVFLTSKLTDVPLPQLAGFAVTISLGTPGPATAASEAPATASPGSHGALGGHALARPGLEGHAASLPSPGASPSASASASAAASASASAQPVASASGSASPAATTSGSAASPKPGHSPSPSASSTPAVHIDTKTTIYPDDAPPPPTPMPTGEVQTFVHRAPIIRGYVYVNGDLPLYGLGAVRFTLPTTEMLPKRGYTIALYEAGKHHHDKLLNFDTDPIVGDGVVHSGQTDPIVLKKNRGYLLLIFGDDEGPAPAAAGVPAGYPSPGNNPFPAPSGANPQPGYTQLPYNPYASPTPYNPYATPTPYGGFGSPHP